MTVMDRDAVSLQGDNPAARFGVVAKRRGAHDERIASANWLTRLLRRPESGAAGVKDLKELVAVSKTKAVTYASPGSGSPMHIMGEMFNQVSGAKLAHVPYRGVAPAINDLLGGHVPATFITYGPVAPHLAGGKIALLGVADTKRSPLAPNVPTLLELGYKDVEVTAWHGLFGPKGLSADIVKTLNGHINEIIKMPDVVQKMAVFGTLPAITAAKCRRRNEVAAS